MCGHVPKVMPVLGSQRAEDFVSGDDRAESQPTLLSLHNVFLLFHNQLADGIVKAAGNRLDYLGDKGKDEAVYQVGEPYAIPLNEYKWWVISTDEVKILIQRSGKAVDGSGYFHDKMGAFLRWKFEKGALLGDVNERICRRRDAS